MKESNDALDVMAMVTDIVAAYVSNHQVDREELPGFIQRVYRSLCNLSSGQSFRLDISSEPAVPIEDSVKPDYLICLEDGRRLKMLKRHLKTAYNMTPEQYRERWGLSATYPMVAPNYANHRQQIAKSIGLGTRRKDQMRKAA